MTDESQKIVDLSEHEKDYLLYRADRDKYEYYKKRVEQHKAQFRKLMGDATLATIAGEDVFTYDKTAAFKGKEFAEDNPVLAAQYTKPVFKDELDVEALKRDHPALYERYRVRQLNTKKVV